MATGTRTYSANAPSTVSPIAFQSAHRFPRPARQNVQCPQNSDGSTATRAPLLELHARARSHDLAGELVAGHERIRGGREVAVGDVHVGPAQPTRADPDDELAGLRGRIGPPADAQLAGRFPDRRFHGITITFTLAGSSRPARSAASASSSP